MNKETTNSNSFIVKNLYSIFLTLSTIFFILRLIIGINNYQNGEFISSIPDSNTQDPIFMGFFCGIIVLLLFIDFGFCLYVKERKFIYFLLFLIFGAIFLITSNGMKQKIDFYYLLTGFSIFSLTFFVLFIEESIADPNPSKRLYSYFILLKTLLLLHLVAMIIWTEGGSLFFMILSPVYIVMLGFAFIIFKKKNSISRSIYLASVSVIFISIIMSLLSGAGYVNSFFQKYSIPAGFLLMSVMVQIALVFNIITKQKTQNEILIENVKEQIELFKNQRIEINNQAEDIRLANQKLTELVELKEGLTSMIVHDLKIPIHNIINCPEKLESDSQLQLIKQSGRNMLNLVMNILDVYKYEKSGIELNLAKVQVSGLLEDALEQVNLLALQKNVTIYYSFPANLFIYADYGIIQRVFINLLTNAIKYTPANGQITINYNEISSTECQFQVIDTGPGIPAEKADLVFAKFGQILAKKTGEIRSSGLGLTFCKIAIETHKGKIGFENNLPNGTKFWFTIPSYKPEIQEENNHHTGHIYNQAVENVKQISPELKTYLMPYVSQLKKIEIYQISKIRKILKQINNTDIDIQIWKDLLIDAVYTNNQGLYSNLLEFEE